MAVKPIEPAPMKEQPKILNAHTFRALNQAPPARRSDEEDDSDDDGPESAPLSPHLLIAVATQLFETLFTAAFNSAFTLLYFTIAPLNDLLLSLRPRRAPHGRPIRVLRMVTMIAQGGVAKVALQTTLRIPPEQARTSLLVFGGKQPIPPSLRAREDVPYIKYKLVLWPGAYKLRMFRHILKLARVIVRSRAELIHVHEPQFAPAVRIAAALAGGRAIAVHLHNDYTVRHAKANRTQRAVQQHALRRARLIACSQTIFDAAVTYLGRTRYPIALIEDGADDRPDCPPDERLAADLARAAAGRRILAKMAHLVPHKRIEDFLIACRILLDEGYPIYVLLMCYGKDYDEPPMREKFNNWFAPAEGEFLFRVHAPQHILNQVGIGVTTSALEGLGLNVLEYQVEGLPVVASDLIPHREMITHGEDGLLFPVGDVPALVRALKQLLGDEALCRQLGEAGRRRAARRTWTETGRRTAEFYQSVLGG